jgi:hypothetical protein
MAVKSGFDSQQMEANFLLRDAVSAVGLWYEDND